MSHEMFGYENDATGPAKWGSLHKEWAVCGDGKKQSPIDITTVEPQKVKEPLMQAYKAGATTIQNRGHDYMVRHSESLHITTPSQNKFSCGNPCPTFDCPSYLKNL
jgi:carbonic anhydrase